MMCKSVCWFPHRKSCQNENLSDWFLVASRSMPLIFIHLLLWISRLPTPSLSDLWTCQESSCVPSGNFTHGNWAFLIDDYLWKKIVLFHRYVKLPKGRTCSRNSQWWSDSCFLCFFWLSCSSMAADSPSSGEKLRDDKGSRSGSCRCLTRMPSSSPWVKKMAEPNRKLILNQTNLFVAGNDGDVKMFDIAKVGDVCGKWMNMTSNGGGLNMLNGPSTCWAVDISDILMCWNTLLSVDSILQDFTLTGLTGPFLRRSCQGQIRVLGD